MKLLSELKINEEAVIESFNDLQLSLKLLEMGCTPGEHVKIVRVAPAGDPIAIEISGYILSMRRQEAKTINVKAIQ
jgi:ferrous iron transport protein A